MQSISRRVLITGLVVGLVISLPFRVSRAATGILDESFGSGGKVDTEFRFESKLSGVAIQSDGKIVAAGLSREFPGYETEMTIVRYTSNGGLDPSFGAGLLNPIYGNGGLVIAGREGYSASDVVVQPDGKIVAGGTGSNDFALVRFKSDGTKDESFGDGGFVTTDFSGGDDVATSLVLQPDGKIIAGGISYPKTILGRTFSFALARYNSDGSLDSSFGEQGRVSDNSPLQVDWFDIALQRDGKIVLLGTDYNAASDYDLVLIRYNSDGRLDHGFGVDGRARVDFGAVERARSLDIDAEGRIVVYGTSVDNYIVTAFADLVVARFEANGTLDSRFGNGGKVKVDFGKFEEAGPIVHQPDGKLIIAGFSSDRPSWHGLNSDFLLVRLKPDGSLDESFGLGGKLTTDFGRTDRASAMALQADGKLVAVGYSGYRGYDGFDPADFAVARYTAFVRPDFTLEAASTVISAERGEKVNVTINVNRLGDFTGKVTISAADPGSPKLKLSPDTVETAGGSAQFKIKIKKSAPRGEHQLVFTGRDDSGRARDVAITLVVR